MFGEKYGRTNIKCQSKNIVAEKGHTEEIESDAQEWEAALKRMERKYSYY